MDKFIIALDSQRLGALDCLRRYNLRFNTNLDRNETSEGIQKGALFHELLRYYYIGRAGLQEVPELLTPYQARDSAIIQAREKIPEIGIQDDDTIICISTFHEYVEHYASEQWQVNSIEAPFSVILHEDDNPFFMNATEYSGLVILWEGIIDLGVTASGETFPVDHKTASRRNYPDELNNQFMGYAFAMQSRQVVVNQIEFKKNPDKFNREFLAYPNFLIDDWVESVVETVKFRLLRAIERDKWAPNFHACNQKFQCVFTKLCKADKQSKKFLMSTNYAVTKPWDVFSRDE